jgi:hypothetical protein
MRSCTGRDLDHRNPLTHNDSWPRWLRLKTNHALPR